MGHKGVCAGLAFWLCSPLLSRAGCRGHFEHVDEGEGILDLFAVHFIFFAKVTLLCLFALDSDDWK